MSCRRPLSLTMFALVVLATGCGGSGAKSGKASTITISNFNFAPQALRARVGDTITVVNKDTAEHTVTATDKSFDTGRFANGTKTFRVAKAGRTEFACEVHPFMQHGFIQVDG